MLQQKEKLKAYEDTGLTPEDIAVLVEKQTPVKPMRLRYYYSCPTCGATRSMKQRHNYCHDCGRKFDW
jgi:hypothetical protein